MTEGRRELQEIFLLAGLNRRDAYRATRLMCRRLGGNDIFFPSGHRDNPFCRELQKILEYLVGDPKSAFKIREDLYVQNAGRALYLPKEMNAFREELCLEILRLMDEGKSVADLTRKYKLTNRTIAKLRREGIDLRIAKQQQSLF